MMMKNDDDDDDEIWSLKVPRWEIDANQISYWKKSSGRSEDDLTIHNVCSGTLERINDRPTDSSRKRTMMKKKEDEEEVVQERVPLCEPTCGKSIRITSPAHRETERFLRLPSVLL